MTYIILSINTGYGLKYLLKCSLHYIPPAKLHYVPIVQHDVRGPNNMCFSALSQQDKHFFIQHSVVGKLLPDQWEEQQGSECLIKRYLLIIKIMWRFFLSFLCMYIDKYFFNYNSFQ